MWLFGGRNSQRQLADMKQRIETAATYTEWYNAASAYDRYMLPFVSNVFVRPTLNPF